MSAYVGGKRLSCIQDSFYKMVKDAMDGLGWLDSFPGTREDVELLAEPLNPGVEIKPNKVSISTEDITSSEMEMGSVLSESRWDVYIDIFAENEFVGTALAGDVLDILRGKFTSLNRDNPSFDVLDYVDDSVMFSCQLENIEINRVRDWDRPYNRFWWVVACQIVDTYYNDVIE